MCAPCSLPRSLQIRIEPIGTSALLLCKNGERLPSQAIRESDGAQSGILDEDGWMFIRHPREGVGLVGLPICGPVGSWQCAFDDMRIEIHFRIPEDTEWRTLERWEDLPLVRANTN